MKNKAVYFLCAVCLAMTACGNTADNVQESITEETTMVTEVTETEKVSETTTAASTETDCHLNNKKMMMAFIFHSH